MINNTLKRVSQFEHRFWLQILGDHARFTYQALSPENKQMLKKTKYFIDSFDQLLSEATTSLSDSESSFLAKRAASYTREFRDFQLNLLEQMILARLSISLTPTFISHMINELEEYLLILKYLLRGQLPPIHNPMHYHLIWLLDAKGHASFIGNSLDDIEKDLIQESEEYQRLFDDLYLKAVELAYYLRINKSDLPAIKSFNQQVVSEMKGFKDFLENLVGLLINNYALGSLSPLVVDHMIREECYYLIKIAIGSGLGAPNCDPTKPRLE